MNHHTYNFRSKGVAPKKGPHRCPIRVIHTKDEFKNQRLVKTPVYEANISEDNLFYGRDMPTPSNKYHKLTTHEIAHTFDYIFDNLKKGAFVQIYKNTIETFTPFDNLTFKQQHLDKVQADPLKYKNINDLFEQSSTLLGFKPIPVVPKESWYMNNSFIRYDDRSGSLNIPIYYDMFVTLQNARDIPDLEFFLNKRDNPLLSEGPYEPYFHLVGSRTYPLKGARSKYTPILSTSKTDDFADVLIPTHDDWCRAVYQETGYTIDFQNRTYPRINPIQWHNKIAKVVFRGTTTGAGTTPETNKRLRMWELVQNLPKHEADLFNVGFVKWNIRPRKNENSPYFDIIKRSNYPIVPFMSTQEQSAYKYILNVEGHVAAFRLGYEMSFGSIILLVESEWKVWFSHMIHPWIHYVPVKADMSDLVEMVMWCEANQDRCQTIVKNALDFYHKYLGTRGILDYLQQTLYNLKKVVGLYVYDNDWLPGQIRLEYDLLMLELNKKQWLWNMKPVSKLGVSDRNYNVLEGVRLALQGSYPNYVSDTRLTVGNLKRSQRRIGSVTVEELQPLQELIAPELIHAAYVARSLNSLLQVIPNFRFMFGILNPNHRFFVSEKYRPYKAPSGPCVNQSQQVPTALKKFIPSQVVSVYQESLLSDETLLDWLNSRTFAAGTSDMVDLLYILIQVNLALQVAQTKCAFMHCNLVPEMIRLLTLPEPTYCKYPIKHNLTLSLRTFVVPIISGYQNARVVVCDEDNYLSDHNYPSDPAYGFKSDKVIDSLTLLITTLQAISNRVPPMYLLDTFNKYFYRYNIVLTEYHLLNKTRFNLRKKNFLWMTNLQRDNPQDTPMAFVNYVLMNTPGKIIQLGKAEPGLTIQPGNPIAYCFMLLERDRQHALRRCINYLARQTFAKPTDPYLQEYVQKLQTLHLKWLSEQVEQGSLSQQFDLYKKFLNEFPTAQPHKQKYGLIEGPDWVINLPYTKGTLQSLRTSKAVKIPGDPITTLDVFTKMSLLDINKDHILNIMKKINSPFDLISSIGKLNSLVWIANN